MNFWRKGDCLVGLKRWDHLIGARRAAGGRVLFLPRRMYLGLFTLAGFDSSKQEAVISPFRGRMYLYYLRYPWPGNK